jgi:anaerobic selenocysteine-containing dehydrogenase
MSNGIKRRDFLKVLGVGGAGATVTGCSTESVEKLLPYVVPPEEITPGVATWYTTVCGGCDAGCGMWVRTREGRVVKVEGNPNHDVSRGALCARGHASIQGLYHPDRFTGPMRRVNGELQPIGWDEAEALLAEQLQAAGGETVFIHGPLGPSMADLAGRFTATVGATAIAHDGLSESALREATRLAFGADVVPDYDFESAHVLISFGADFLETWGSPVAYSRGFSRMSSVDDHGEKGQFIFVGPRLSLTGQNADEWMPIQPGAEAAVALGMASTIAADGADAGPWADVLAEWSAERAAEESGLDAETIRDLARRFVANGPSLALGPGLAAQHRNATAAHVAVHILNAVAGNVGTTVRLASNRVSTSSAPAAELKAALDRMAAGQVAVALVHGTNPAYTLPAATGFGDAFSNVGFKVSFATEPNETSELADLILPDRHFLEAWGDSNPVPGLFAVQQPTMQPVPHFEAKQTGDVLLSVASRIGGAIGPATFYDHLVARWQDVHAQVGSGTTFEMWWKQALKDGSVQVASAPAEAPVALQAPDAALSFAVPQFDGQGEFNLVIYPSSRFGDGKFATSPWMQELPDPVSKLAWHSWVELHPDAAERLGVRDGDVVVVESEHGSIEAPVWTYPGVRDDTIAIAMGGGRTLWH